MKIHLQRYARMSTAIATVAGFCLLATQIHAQIIRKDKGFSKTAIIEWDFNGDGEFDTESLVRAAPDGEATNGEATAGEVRIPVMENGVLSVQEFGTGLGTWARFRASGTVLLQVLHRNRAEGPTPYRFLTALVEFKLPSSGSTDGGSGNALPGLAYIAAFPSVEALLEQNPSLSGTVAVQGWNIATNKSE